MFDSIKIFRLSNKQISVSEKDNLGADKETVEKITLMGRFQGETR